MGNVAGGGDTGGLPVEPLLLTGLPTIELDDTWTASYIYLYGRKGWPNTSQVDTDNKRADPPVDPKPPVINPPPPVKPPFFFPPTTGGDDGDGDPERKGNFNKRSGILNKINDLLKRVKKLRITLEILMSLNTNPVVVDIPGGQQVVLAWEVNPIGMTRQEMFKRNEELFNLPSTNSNTTFP